MRVVVHDSTAGTKPQQFDFGSRGFSIGRDPTCEVQLQGQFVSRLQAKVDRAPSGWEITVPGVATNGVEIDVRDGKTRRTAQLDPGKSMPIHGDELIRIAHFTVELTADGQTLLAVGAQKAINDQVRQLHMQVLRQLDLRIGDLDDLSRRPQRVRELNGVIDGLVDGSFGHTLFAAHADTLLRLAFRERVQYWGIEGADRWIAKNFGVNPDLEATLSERVKQLHDRIVANRVAEMSRDGAIEQRFEAEFAAIAKGLYDNLRRYAALSYVKKQLYDLILELGPLTPLLECSDVSEVMVVSPSLIYVERDRDVIRSAQVFPNSESAVSVIERIVAPLGRRIDRSQPLVDARLADGSRVNAVIEPLALKGPCITIRRFPAKPLLIEDLLASGSLNEPAVELLRGCVRHRCNLIVAGGTGSGKTTLLNAFSSFIPHHERLVTIEDAAELKLQQEHVVSLETRSTNAEGKGGYATRDLVRNALRMRPDRIIVGECRGGEALDMLQAMNTGHSGSMTTLHANSAEDVPARLETLVLMSDTIPLASVRRQIAEAIDFIVYVSRVPGLGRRVTQISEVVGLHPQSGEVEIRHIMHTIRVGGRHELKVTGYMPRVLGDMVERGNLDLSKWFTAVRRK